MRVKLSRKLSVILAVFFMCQNSVAQWKMSYTIHFHYATSVVTMDYNHIILSGGNEFNDRIRLIYTTPDTANSWEIALGDNNTWLKSINRAGLGKGLVTCGYEGAILKSLDAGVTWNWLTAPSSVSSRHFNSVFFVDSLVGYIVGGFSADSASLQTIIKTTNGGISWNVQRDTLSRWLKSVYFSDAEHGIATGSYGTVLRTTNGGATWQRVTLGDSSIATRDLNGVYMLDNNVGYIVGGRKSNDAIQTIIKTTDGGITWQVIHDELGPMFNAIDFSSAAKAYIVGDSGTVFHSVDTGNTWTNLNLPDSLTESHLLDFLDVDFKNDSFGMIAGRAMALRYYIPKAPEVPITPEDTALIVVTKGATNVSETGARIHGIVTSDGSPLRLRFQYGTTPDLGTYIPAEIYSVLNTTPTPVSVNLPRLAPNTLYYYRLEAVGGGNTYEGSIRTFYTSSCILPNCDFEDWSENSPSRWSHTGETERVIDRVSGNYAVRLSSRIDSVNSPAIIRVFDHGVPGAAFHVYDRYNSLNGYYKFLPQNGDTLFVSIVMYKNGNQIGNVSYVIDSSFVSWHPFSFAINYYDSETIPDSAQVSFSIGSHTVHGASELYLDNISFDGFRQMDSTTLGINTFSGSDAFCRIYPNPAQSVLNIEYVVGNGDNSTIVITDIQGRTVFEEKIGWQTSEVNRQIEIKNLVNGVYVARISSRLFDVKQKICIEH